MLTMLPRIPVRMLTVVLQTTDLGFVALYLSEDLGGLLSSRLMLEREEGLWKGCVIASSPRGSIPLCSGGRLSTFQLTTPFLQYVH